MPRVARRRKTMQPLGKTGREEGEESRHNLFRHFHVRHFAPFAPMKVDGPLASIHPWSTLRGERELPLLTHSSSPFSMSLA